MPWRVTLSPDPPAEGMLCSMACTSGPKSLCRHTLCFRTAGAD